MYVSEAKYSTGRVYQRSMASINEYIMQKTFTCLNRLGIKNTSSIHHAAQESIQAQVLQAIDNKDSLAKFLEI